MPVFLPLAHCSTTSLLLTGREPVAPAQSEAPPERASLPSPGVGVCYGTQLTHPGLSGNGRAAVHRGVGGPCVPLDHFCSVPTVGRLAPSSG